MSERVKVDLIAETNVDPETLASHAARTCYTATVPELGNKIDVENRLFKTGHHTTLEHNYFTFNIDGIPVSSVVFGLHLTAPFYDTDQRSGRFSKMYDEPDMREIKSMLFAYYPEAGSYAINQATCFIEQGLNIYADNKSRVTELARDAVRRERPNASEKYIEQNAPKLAQEQLRMFVSMIAPTALDYTIDLVTLAALWRSAWTPFMRDAVTQMANLVRTKHNGIDYMFTATSQGTKDWSPKMPKYSYGVKRRPEFKLLDYRYDDKSFAENDAHDMVDTLQFSPDKMNNSMGYVHSQIHVDAGATMGQDQRHRTIKRSMPEFTGHFYLPPLLFAGDLYVAANKFMSDFARMYRLGHLSPSMITAIAPYGAMVQYEKMADLNALVHEQGKRTCWCAQEAIYHISCDLRRDLGQYIGQNAKLMKYLTPPCLSMGKCPEGARYCGRDIVNDKINGYFRQRQI